VEKRGVEKFVELRSFEIKLDDSIENEIISERKKTAHRNK
jgi:hypothetical protein